MRGGQRPKRISNVPYFLYGQQEMLQRQLRQAAELFASRAFEGGHTPV